MIVDGVKTLVGLVVIAILCAGVGVGYAFWARPQSAGGGMPREDDARFREAFEASAAEATALGWNEVRDGEDGRDGVEAGDTWSRQIDLAEGECVALIAVPTGCVEVETARLVESDGEEPLVSRTYRSLDVAHLQWCAWLDPVSITAQVTLRHEPRCALEHTAEGVLHWRVSRGQASGVAGSSGLSQPLGLVDRQAFDEAAALAWLAVRGDVEHSPPLVVDLEGGAALVPDALATCHALYALTNRAGRLPNHPRLAEASRRGCPPAGVVSSDPVDPIIARGEGWDRVLAVIDRGALGAPCVEIELVRLRLGRRVDPVRRLGLDGELRTLNDVGGEGFVFSDRACPASGVFAYVVPASDHASYAIRWHTTVSPEGISAGPAETPTGPFPTEVSEPIAAQLRRCERRDANACDAVARARLTGEGAPLDRDRAMELFARSCELGSPEGCAYQGASLLSADRGRSLLVRACDGGFARACAQLGDAERRTEGAPEDAMIRAQVFYLRGCELDLASACSNAELLVTLRLAPRPAP